MATIKDAILIERNKLERLLVEAKAEVENSQVNLEHAKAKRQGIAIALSELNADCKR